MMEDAEQRANEYVPPTEVVLRNRPYVDRRAYRDGYRAGLVEAMSLVRRRIEDYDALDWMTKPEKGAAPEG